MTIRPRRSVLYMPANNARAIEKARTLAVDGVILDLEDAVAPEAKEAARASAVQAVKAGGFGSREVFIRVNGIGTAWGAADLTAAALARPDAILLPKVSTPETLEAVARHLLDMRADLHIRVWAMIETPMAVLRVHEIAAMSRDVETRLAGLVLGTNDLVKETRGRVVPRRWPLLPSIGRCILAARAYGLAVLDGVHNEIADSAAFEAECHQGRDMGFDGKTLIHPSQIDTCNTVYSPTKIEVEEARKIIAAFDLPENHNKGVLKIDGRMVERLHADIARCTVAIADAMAG
jgi:citrate lyase subunit beta/citryl-CoA lyase